MFSEKKSKKMYVSTQGKINKNRFLKLIQDILGVEHVRKIQA